MTYVRIFDFEKAIAGLRSGKDLVGNEGVLMPLIVRDKGQSLLKNI
jgi:hypothetical protein